MVVELFAPCKRNLDLDETAAEINAQRDQRISVLLHLAVQPHDLTLVHEQPARAKRILVEDIALLVGRDVHLPDEKLPVLDLAPGFLQAERAEADGFDLGSGEFDAGLEFFIDEIFMERFLVPRGDLHALRHGTHLPPAIIRCVLYVNYISHVKRFPVLRVPDDTVQQILLKCAALLRA